MEFVIPLISSPYIEGPSSMKAPKGSIKWLASLVEDVQKLQRKGSKIIIVSSGAIALGRKILSKKKLTNLHEKQAAASIGQIQLSQEWQKAFAKCKIQSSQIFMLVRHLAAHSMIYSHRSRLEYENRV